ncbi:hypothetical protein SAMN05216428_10128 [Nitrosospira sp. Nsp11]|nr:hypothetical protein SAMN05216428_10128 [Nitrosospira sp. Nsp11]
MVPGRSFMKARPNSLPDLKNHSEKLTYLEDFEDF